MRSWLAAIKVEDEPIRYEIGETTTQEFDALAIRMRSAAYHEGVADASLYSVNAKRKTRELFVTKTGWSPL